jgi:hypothetical protein
LPTRSMIVSRWNACLHRRTRIRRGCIVSGDSGLMKLLKSFILCPLAAFRYGSKCARTNVYAPLLSRIAPC